MKRILLLSIAAIIMMYAGCKKENPTTSKFKMNISSTEGTETKTEAWSSIALDSVATKYSDKFIIAGKSDSGKVMVINISGTEKKTYSLASGTMEFSATFTDGSLTYIASSGSITLTSIVTGTKKISGIFNFKAASTSVPVKTKSFSGEFTDLLYLDSGL